MSERKPLSEDRRKFNRVARLQREQGQGPNPSRITTALDTRGLYGPEVDVACGTVEPAVDRWEDPDDPLLPTEAQVRLLADLTGFPVPFFYARDTAVVGPMVICGADGCEVVDQRPDAKVVELRRPC